MDSRAQRLRAIRQQRLAEGKKFFEKLAEHTFTAQAQGETPPEELSAEGQAALDAFHRSRPNKRQR